MIDIHNKITEAFSILTDLGLTFSFINSNGKLNDREILKFTWDNPSTKRQIEIVFVKSTYNTSLYGYLKNYSKQTPENYNLETTLPFDRIRCFFNENEEIIFFGNEQYTIDYKLKEYRLIINRFINCIMTNAWVDKEKLLAKERRIYTLTLEPPSDWWINSLLKNNDIRDNFQIVFNSNVEPEYETYGLRFLRNDNVSFHIIHGHKSRDEESYKVAVIIDNKTVATQEFIDQPENNAVLYMKYWSTANSGLA